MNLIDLKNRIIDDWRNHGKDWTKPGFRAVAVYRLGNWSMTRTGPLPMLLWRPLYRVLYHRVRNHYGIEIPGMTRIGKGLIVEHQGAIVVHSGALIGENCYIRQGVTIGMRHIKHNNDVPTLGDRVDIGAGAKILGKITIGNDVNIGANAVVLHDVPSGHTAVGIPAKIFPSNSTV